VKFSNQGTTRLFFGLALVLVITPTLSRPALGQGQDLNEPPPLAVRQLIENAVNLAESDRPRVAVALLKRALSISPNNFRAHVEYRNIKANFLDRYDEVETEYQSLIKRNPANPVYPMAVYYRSKGNTGRESLQKVIELAPEWAWADYARALLIQTEDPETAVVDLMRCIDKDSGAIEAYELLIELQEGRLHRLDDAIRTAARLAGQKDIRATLRLPPLWRLRLVKAQRSKESKQALRNELEELAGRTREVDVLQAVRSAYLDLLGDEGQAVAVERQIEQIDPSWTRQRGWLYTQVKVNQSGVPRRVVLVNRQIVLQEKVQEITNALEVGRSERIKQLEKILSQSPSAAMQRIIHEEIFALALSSNNVVAARISGNTLRIMDPNDAALLSKIAVIYANKREHLVEALWLARKAMALTAEFQPAKRPTNTPQGFLDSLFPEKQQRAAHQRNRALGLDGLGWVLVQTNRAQTAEPLLRQALEIERSEERLLHRLKPCVASDAIRKRWLWKTNRIDFWPMRSNDNSPLKRSQIFKWSLLKAAGFGLPTLEPRSLSLISGPRGAFPAGRRCLFWNGFTRNIKTRGSKYWLFRRTTIAAKRGYSRRALNSTSRLSIRIHLKKHSESIPFPQICSLIGGGTCVIE